MGVGKQEVQELTWTLLSPWRGKQDERELTWERVWTLGRGAGGRVLERAHLRFSPFCKMNAAGP